MSAVYQDVIEGYLIASIKVFSLVNLNLNFDIYGTKVNISTF